MTLKHNPINQIIHGNCIEILQSGLILSNSIDCVITDPPYNYEVIGINWNHDEITRRLNNVNKENSKTLIKHVPYGNGLSGGKRNANWYKKHKENNQNYIHWCESWADGLFKVCKSGANVLVFNDVKHIAHVQTAFENIGFFTKDIIVYRKNSGIPKGLNLTKQLEKKNIKPDSNMLESCDLENLHSMLRNEWEAILVCQKPLENNHFETFMNFQTGLFNVKPDNQNGFQSNIIENIQKTEYDKINDSEYNNAVHCTPKPLMLMKKLISIFSPNLNGIILDCFAGSGTTLLAAKQLNRKYIGIEIEQKYIDLIQYRLNLLNNK